MLDNAFSQSTLNCAASINIPSNRTVFIPIRFAELKGNHDYLFTPYPNHIYMPKDTYVLQIVAPSNQDGIYVRNVGDKDETIKKGCCIGHISRFRDGAAPHKAVSDTVKSQD